MTLAKTLTHEGFYSADDGARLFYRERPADHVRGEEVVLLHSLFFCGAMFDEVASQLPSAYRLLAPDHRGQGRSADASTTASAPTIVRLAKDVINFIDASVGGPVHLVGSSMGGYVALEIALQRPDLLRSCTLSCCTAAAEKEPERFARLEDALRTQGPAALVDTICKTMFGDSFLSQDREAAARWADYFGAGSPAIADAVHEVFARASYEQRLERIKLPLLLFSGAQDRAKRPADMQFIAERVGGSRHLTIEQAGHTPPVEAPTEFAEALLQYWAVTIPEWKQAAGT